jgi:hypothetical protein
MASKMSRRGIIATLLALALLPPCVAPVSSLAEEEATEPATAETAIAQEADETTAEAEAAIAQETDDTAATAKAAKGGVSPQANMGWYQGHVEGASYTLNNKEEMLGLAELVNNEIENFSNNTITLGTDIIGLSTEPIGTKDYPFAGTFDGGGKTLSNLSITLPQGRTDGRSYVGLFGKTAAGSLIKNLNIDAGTLSVAESRANGERILYVGAVAGYAGGDIEDCTSSMELKVSSNRALGNDEGIIRYVGGLAGYIAGDMKRCVHDGDLYINSASDITEDIRYLIGEVGGLAGGQGDILDPATLPQSEECVNSGNLIFSVTGDGGRDRFGAQLYSVSYAVGGIIGQTSGTVSNCTNSGIVNTSGGTAENPKAGRGAGSCGGIVGSLRGIAFKQSSDSQINTNSSMLDTAYRYYVSHGGVDGAPSSYPRTAGVYDCANTGDVIGLAAVGGIVGNGGSFTEIEGCTNKATVKGCRWNKPFAGGIAGNIQGNVRYCYNRGAIHSVTGGGYFCAGIAGGLWTPNTALTADEYRAPTTEMAGCYTTGRIYTDSAGFRTGILAGENEGFIHDNAYLSGLSVDGKIVDTDTGTVKANAELTTAKLKGSEGIGLLNAYAAGKGGWKVCYLPDADAQAAVNGGYPVLVRSDDAHGNLSISGATTPAVAQGTVTPAAYSAVSDPIPQIAITKDGGSEKLIQNADFRVEPQAGARDVTIGGADTTPYTATIIGIGKYTGTLGTFSYGIDKAEISTCTIVSDAVLFDWERQSPVGRTKLIDAAGNEVPAEQYEVSDLYDDNPNGIGSTKPVNVNPNGVTDLRYYDYKNAHGANYKYDVRVTATTAAIANYKGETVQPAFRIKWASMVAQLPTDDPHYDPNQPESVVYGDVVWQGKSWNFIKAMRDTSGDTIQIEYTGRPIKPTARSVTYLGRPLRLATDYSYQSNPLDYDYKYIYGNPNPEQTGGVSYEPTDVTPAGQPSCMTVRFTNGGNFDNYTNVFFRIVPADIGAAAASMPAQNYTGQAHTPRPQIVWNGMALTEGKDYTVSGLTYASNIAAGTATAGFTISGMGNFKGSKQMSAAFAIAPKDIAQETISVTVADCEWTGKARQPVPRISFAGAQLAEGEDYTISDLKYGANKAIGKATVSFSVNGAGSYAGTQAKSVSFIIHPARTKIQKLVVGKKSLTVSFKKSAAAQKVTGYQLRYRAKGTSKWKTVSVAGSKNSAKLKSLKRGARYEVQVCAVKKIKSGASKGTYSSQWSASKLSRKIK